MSPGERVWVLDRRGLPMTHAVVDGKTLEGLVVVRFDSGLKSPLPKDKLKTRLLAEVQDEPTQ